MRLTPERSRISPAQLLELADQRLEDQSHAGQRPRQALHEDGAEHYGELPEIHISLAAAAVEQQRAEEHLDQQRIVEQPADHFPRRTPVVVLVEVIVIGHFGHEPIESIDLAGKAAADLGSQDFEVVVELK